MGGGVADALVERHHDVATEGELDVHGRFRREQVRVAVQVRLEQDAFVGHLAEIAEAEDLEAAGIGQDGARPGHETVQAAQLADGLVARAEEQVIGVGQDDLGVELLDEIALGDALDRGLRAHRHEDRRLDVAVRRVEHAGARPGFRALGEDFERDDAQETILAGRAEAAAARPRTAPARWAA